MKCKPVILSILCAAVFLTAAGCQSGSGTAGTASGKQPAVSSAASEPGGASSGEDSQIAKEDSQAAKTEPEESVSEPEESILEMGTEGTLKTWNVTVSSMDFTDSISDNEYTAFKPQEGNLYLSIAISVKNTGKQADIFLPSYGFGDDISAKVLYGDGYEYSSTNLLGYSKELHNVSLNPLSSTDSEITFALPIEVAESSVPLVLRLTSGKETLSYRVG